MLCVIWSKYTVMPFIRIREPLSHKLVVVVSFASFYCFFRATKNLNLQTRCTLVKHVLFMPGLY